MSSSTCTSLPATARRVKKGAVRGRSDLRAHSGFPGGVARGVPIPIVNPPRPRPHHIITQINTTHQIASLRWQTSAVSVQTPRHICAQQFRECSGFAVRQHGSGVDGTTILTPALHASAPGFASHYPPLFPTSLPVLAHSSAAFSAAILSASSFRKSVGALGAV